MDQEMALPSERAEENVDRKILKPDKYEIKTIESPDEDSKEIEITEEKQGKMNYSKAIRNDVEEEQLENRDDNGNPNKRKSFQLRTSDIVNGRDKQITEENTKADRIEDNLGASRETAPANKKSTIRILKQKDHQPEEWQRKKMIQMVCENRETEARKTKESVCGKNRIKVKIKLTLVKYMCRKLRLHKIDKVMGMLVRYRITGDSYATNRIRTKMKEEYRIKCAVRNRQQIKKYDKAASIRCKFRVKILSDFWMQSIFNELHPPERPPPKPPSIA